MTVPRIPEKGTTEGNVSGYCRKLISTDTKKDTTNNVMNDVVIM